MGPVLFVMAILGCGEGDAACQQVRTVETPYRSEAACLAATEGELARSDADYPTLFAQCRPAGSAAATIRASEILLPRGGVLPSVLPSPRYADASSVNRR
ncbi:hypothetical protein GCM10023232_28330 [Sphingosinicella ginsenosidimutans]|jgi:hypothetical protein|uniref:Uncharacterized protein n=1 Tax=Allosphingosinicella ginsenosidimutans TaxID=1176539 RepID=A0A5C6TTW6_9SPHN|nr:hypothetical protein [Sphingosinicella ginsenosidimutans]TXC63148.1 hypothetical protein FRZ32_05435 [Sphingosinicella ginsenosidimutans]